MLTGRTPAEVKQVPRDTARLRTNAERARADRDDRAGREQARLERDAARIQADFASQAVIEQAKGIIAVKYNIGVEEAFDAIRKDARDRNDTVGAVCARVVAATNSNARRRVRR
jgi:AmiR/NasT family two-component response regulator